MCQQHDHHAAATAALQQEHRSSCTFAPHCDRLASLRQRPNGRLRYDNYAERRVQVALSGFCQRRGRNRCFGRQFESQNNRQLLKGPEITRQALELHPWRLELESCPMSVTLWTPLETWDTFFFLCLNLYLGVASNPVTVIVQELRESRGGRPGLSVLTSLLASVDVKIYWTVLRHWSQLVPNTSTDIWGH